MVKIDLNIEPGKFFGKRSRIILGKVNVKNKQLQLYLQA
jgi:hypothetical protein